MKGKLLLAAVIGLTAALYSCDLAGTPVYFGGDEAHFAVKGHSLATTGRNLNGDLFPVFVNLADPLGGKQQEWGDTWYQPVLFYLTALAVKVLPFNITTVRLPMALIGGVVTPLLMFLLARRLFGSILPAAVAALIIALAPMHVVLSRQALDYVLPLPFVIGWLWCLHRYRETRDARFALALGALLGLGCYSYIASWALMPAFLLISWLLFQSRGAVVVSAAAFAIPAGVAVAWVLAHPEMLDQTMTRYGVTEGPKAGALETYVSLFHPSVWFVRGGPSLVTSTARSGFVLLPVAVLLAAGVLTLWRRRDWLAFAIVAGLLVSPLPAAFKGEPLMIQRAMYLLPFVALLGALGFSLLWNTSKLLRVGALLIAIAAPVQFAYFYFDYFTHYKFRSAFYYDPVAFRDVAAYLMAHGGDAPAFFFTEDVDDASVKWRFYTAVNETPHLLPRARYVAPESQPEAQPGSLLVTYDRTNRLTALQQAGWRIETIVHDVDNRPAAVILRKLTPDP